MFDDVWNEEYNTSNIILSIFIVNIVKHRLHVWQNENETAGMKCSAFRPRAFKYAYALTLHYFLEDRQAERADNHCDGGLDRGRGGALPQTGLQPSGPHTALRHGQGGEHTQLHGEWLPKIDLSVSYHM